MNAKKIIDEYILFALEKYGTMEEVAQRIINYYYGDIRSITRERNMRNNFINNVTKESIDLITSKDIFSYVRNTINNNAKSGFMEKYSYFLNLTCQIVSMYGYNGLENYLLEALKNNNPDINNSIRPDEIYKLCAYYLDSRGYDMSKPVENIFELYSLDLSSYVTELNQKTY